MKPVKRIFEKKLHDTKTVQGIVPGPTALKSGMLSTPLPRLTTLPPEFNKIDTF